MRQVPASGADVRKEGDSWVLVLERELGHPPAKVWKALTEPEHLREWAPFDADRNSARGGRKLSTVGTPQVSETRIKRADATKLLEYNWGGQDIRWELEPLRGAAPGSRSGTTSIVASYRWARPAGTSASMF